MLRKSTGIALLILIVPSLASLGPPPGSRGVIDFRYPDYIVDPRPDCPSEGVFPHPRNCSWYYRCHDPYGVGYYHQNYFECEPGTVFSDELDQCIHPFNAEYPCLPAKPTLPPTTTEPTPDCYDSMIKCKVYLCPNENNVMLYIGRLCETAYSVCDNGASTSYCSSNQFFDVLTRTCVQPPGERNCVDEETFDSTATPPTSTTTTTTTLSPVAPDDCYDSMVECREYQCPGTSDVDFLCKRAFRTCNNNQVTSFCNAGNFFNHRTKQCVSDPNYRGCVEVQKTTTTTTEAVDPSLLTFTYTVECSVENPRPKDTQLVEYFCDNYTTCTRSGGITQVELCTKYLQCLRDNNAWKAVVMTCPPGLYFSYENDICTQKPDDTCIGG